MENNFNLLANIPLIVLVFFVILDFSLFVWATVLMIKARKDYDKAGKGRKILFSAFFGLFAIALAVLVFYGVSFILRQGEVFYPKISTGEFPASLYGDFPPPPQFIAIGQRPFKYGRGNYYFQGPLSFKEINGFGEPVVFALLCKKDGNYDIISVEATLGSAISQSGNYNCWQENCQESGNRYVAFFKTPLKKYGTEGGAIIASNIKKEINMPCGSQE